MSDEDDISTNDVIDWIDYSGYRVLRINESTEVYFDNFSISPNGSSDWTITVRDKVYSFNQISNYWYRRGVLVLEHDFIEMENKPLQKKINTYLSHEMHGVQKLIRSKLLKVKGKVGNWSDNYISKGNVLQLAAECGLLVPDTLITSNLADLENFVDKHEFVITKAISEGIAARVSETKKLNGFTTLVDRDQIKDFPKRFFPTLFQEGLDKKWEIRAFYINEKIYSTAIFSQKDETTKVDFRHYGKKYPNRTPPYELPDEIKVTIIKLMKRLRMQSGSIDLVYTKQKEYVFLEVNPVGQFAQVSDPCNYYLEEIIANELINAER